MHSHCYCIGLCNISCTTVWCLWRFPVQLTHYLMHADCPKVRLYNELVRSNWTGDGVCNMYCTHYGCSGVGMCSISCTAVALVFACVPYHALWLLLCLPVYCLMHSKRSRTDHCHIECARITFVFAVVIVHAADCDCSCVCLCNVSWALTAMVCACARFYALWLLLRLQMQSICL